MGITRHLPNFLTSLNLLCGTLATYSAINGQLELAVWLIFIGALFDFSDGFVARALKAYSPMGKELDSLADLISFGMAPAAILSTILKYLITKSYDSLFFELSTIEQAWILSPFLLTVFAGLRLAKFNVDTRQTENFLGLTTTATGIFTASFAYAFANYTDAFGWLKPYMVLVTVLIFCSLLVSEVPMFSLKFKSIKWKENQHRFMLLLLAIVLIFWLGIGGVAVVIFYYIVISVGQWFFIR
ncbi:CDP-alcohol phosphatidyltransferase [Marinilabiliaceae bacterium JC017]|nr:CDP-alcohol phosphatidyltransferase [Marinilabiliaceae bacterium JC017]